jgi:hypothetical protein
LVSWETLARQKGSFAELAIMVPSQFSVGLTNSPSAVMLAKPTGSKHIRQMRLHFIVFVNTENAESSYLQDAPANHVEP